MSGCEANRSILAGAGAHVSQYGTLAHLGPGDSKPLPRLGRHTKTPGLLAALPRAHLIQTATQK